jgi:hypothetical protein
LVHPSARAVNIGSLQTFNTLPDISEFATFSIAGTGGTITTVTDFDSAVQTNAILANFTNGLNQTTGNPIGNLGLARWSQTGLYIGTRPTGNDGTLLLCRVTNSTAGSLNSVSISYDLTAPNPAPGSEDPGLNGQRVFYSLTAAAGSWTLIPELTTFTPGALLATVNIGTWPRGAVLYILWADDNGGPGTDSGFQIDNFVVATTVDPPTITGQPHGTNVIEGQTISLTVVATGLGLTYSWQKAGGSIDPNNPTISQSTLVITNATLADAGTYFVVVQNSAGSRTSQNAVVGVGVDNIAPTLVSGQIDPLDDFRVTVQVSEPLCVDSASCGTDATANFLWHIRRKDDPSTEIGVTTVVVSNLTVILTSGLARDVGVAYIVTVDAFSIGDVHNPPNINQTELSVDLGLALGFKQGLHGYAGTHDTELRGAAPDTVQVANTFVTVDLDDAGGISYGLLRFEGVFGSNPDQVPLGAEITTATLTITHSAANANGDPVEMHRLLIPFDEATATYNNFGPIPGLQADGTEAAIAVDTLILSAGLVVPFTFTIDVKTTVQAWSNGDPNYGWGFVPTGTDGYRWDTSESANPPGLVITYRVVPCNTPPIITTPPPSQSVTEGSTFTFSPVFTACSASFQWTKDGTDIPAANTAVYSGTAVAGPGGSAGAYRLRITNPNGTVTSAPGTLTVVNDTTRPNVIAAEGNLAGNSITLTFSKSMKATAAQSTANYTLTPSVAVTAAVLGADGTTVTLTTGQRAVGTSSLRIANLTDDRFLSNPLDPNPTTVPITSVSLALGYGAGTWKYETNSQDATLSSGTPWYAPGFNDGSWQSGQAFFGFETGQAVTNSLPPPRIVTVLPPNSDVNFPDAAVTSYFRRQINLPPVPAGGVYAICHYIDDGAIFYLDGVELGRYNMPEPGAPVVFTNRASAAIEASLNCFFFTAPAGNHSLAIEIHQGGVTTSDVVFGAEIVAMAAPPRLTAVHDPGGVRVNWNGDSSWQLVQSVTVNGAFAATPGAPLGTHLVPTASATNTTFFHLRYRDPQ